MRILSKHPKKLMVVAFGVAVAVIVLIAAVWGPSGFFGAFSHLHPVWLLLVGAGAALAPAAYTLSYLELSHVGDVPPLPVGLAARIVALGFGPFVPSGGLHADKRALQRIDGDEAAADTQVFAIGWLELALLTPVAWVCALILVLVGDHKPMPSELWPWIVLVPVGFGLVLGAIAWVRSRELDVHASGIRGVGIRAASGAAMLLELPRRPRHGWPALLGMAGYWAADLAAFYGAARCFGLHINLAEAILAYATGYALTRRSMPLGGAGVTEALLTFALHWVGQPVAPALAVVVLYRIFNFLAPSLPALWAHAEVAHLVSEETDRGPTTPPRQEPAAATS